MVNYFTVTSTGMLLFGTAIAPTRNSLLEWQSVHCIEALKTEFPNEPFIC
jgi:hypothetical protein